MSDILPPLSPSRNSSSLEPEVSPDNAAKMLKMSTSISGISPVHDPPAPSPPSPSDPPNVITITANHDLSASGSDHSTVNDLLLPSQKVIVPPDSDNDQSEDIDDYSWDVRWKL